MAPSRLRTPRPFRLRHIMGVAAMLLSVACFTSDPDGGESSADLAGRAAEGQGGIALPPPIARDMPAIASRETLTVLLTFNSTTYFLYRGEPLGYEYEALKAFAKDQGLVIRAKIADHIDSMFVMLNRGEGDVLAARLVPVAADSGRVLYTRALYLAFPSLVQQRAPADSAMASLPGPADTLLKAGDRQRLVPVNVRARLVERPEQLVNRNVTLAPRSPYRETLMELADSVGDIHVVELEKSTSTETLIRDVARGTVEYTVADDNLAKIQESYFSNILIRPVLGEEKKVSWAVRRNAPLLQRALDGWIASPRGQTLLKQLYRKYFIDASAYRERVESRYLTSVTGTLSPYDGLFKFYAPKINWDWRLLASQAYQESRFKPDARSWVGATGLMQIMPATGRDFGVTRLLDPEENIRGGVKYLEWLTKYWTKHISDPGERLKFILASYNTGIGHVEDAQRLALKNGNDSKYWSDVAYWLLQKSKREIYTDPVVKFGFSRGIEPVTYVSLILERYDHYRQFVVNTAVAAAADSATAKSQQR